MAEHTSIFTIHTKDGPLRKNPKRRYSSRENRINGTPYCTVTLKGAERIVRDRNAVPCVIIETRVVYNEEGDYFFHQTHLHKLDE